MHGGAAGDGHKLVAAMENRRNYYRILQVQPGAPVEIIRASYRTLMQRLKAHPDLGGDHHSAALINEAYAVLANPARRAAYDRELEARVFGARGTDTSATGTARSLAAARCHFCGAGWAGGGERTDANCGRCGSPLHCAAPELAAADGRRAIPRLPRQYPVTIYTEWPPAAGLRGETRDVSPHGISFVTSELIPPEAVVKLESELCRAVLKVANTRVEEDGADGLWLVGAQFLAVAFPHPRGGFLSAEA